jgi:signal peptidase II
MSRRVLAAAILAVVAADWASKFLVQNHLDMYSTTHVLGEWLKFVFVENHGVSGGMMGDLPPLVRLPLLTVLALAGLWVCVHILRRTSDGATRLAAALVISGAVGNLGDRLLDGAVTDFIVIRWFPYIFNVADVAITAGAVLLALRMVQGADTDADPAPGGAAPA